MARPRKQEVDYFPHYCEHGKVLFILENYFKNDGYAVFYKIEEILAKTEGHCYDCSKLENWEYLLSKMTTTEDIVNAILQKLSSMGVIDEALWGEKRIWMQSFVDSISDAYVRRKVQLPVRPGLMSTLIPLSGINDNINSQSKVKESKGKESRTPSSPPQNNVPADVDKNIWEAFVKMRKKIKAPLTDEAIDLTFTNLENIAKETGQDKNEILKQSIQKSWRGVFAIKESTKEGKSSVYYD